MTSQEVLNFQFKCFKKEYDLYRYLYEFEIYDKYNYYPETVIWNRSHLGEYVYSQMFRGGKPEMLKNMLLEYERRFISFEVYLITLTADPEFFNSRESDGHELSKTIEEKTKELELFKEAHKFSIIANKHLLKVDMQTETSTGTGWIMKSPNIFRPKEDILNEVIEFIN
jgi:hypothetical protein